MRAILRHKSGMTLAEDDTRHDNLDAVDLYHDVLARVLTRMRADEGDKPVGDLKSYAAAIAHNAWSDYLRDKYPKRASLKNRIRYFLAHQPRYAVWESIDGELVGGLRKWQLSGARPAPTGRLAGLRNGTERLPSQGLPRRAIENCDAEDWDRLLGTIFEVLGGPADLDGLVAAVIELCGLKEDWQESLGGGDDDEVAEDLSDAIADSGSTPEQDAEVNSALRQLWTAITRLKNDYRCAYLLNIPGPGKSRGDIEVFAMRGIASIVEIGAAIDLSERQYELLWGLLDLEAADFGELARISSPEQKFCLLWKYLPLDDATIARLLGLERQQVINRRTMAVRELARSCGSNGRE